MPQLAMSKRQKKKIKQVQVVHKTKDKEIERVISYLKLWTDNRSEWKYEKLRQIFIQQNIYDDKMISDEYVDLAIEYLASTKVCCSTILLTSELNFIVYFILFCCF